MIRSYAIFWVVLVIVAVINGAVRELTYGRNLRELRAHQLSTFTGMFLSGIATWLFARFYPIGSIQAALVIGLIWVVLTIAFEFVFGRYVAGHSWTRLLADYNLPAGRVWLVFLVWLLTLPSIVYWLEASSG